MNTTWYLHSHLLWLNSASGGDGQFNRAANIGLASSWGEVKLGRQLDPNLLVAVQLDALGSQSGGLNRPILRSL
jgi:predicted porin